jgi:hypothetical protein
MNLFSSHAVAETVNGERAMAEQFGRLLEMAWLTSSEGLALVVEVGSPPPSSSSTREALI